MEKLINGAKRLGIELTPSQLEQFQLYYEELVKWNERMNLTAITDYEEVQTKHFLDSLTIVLAFNNEQFAQRDFCLLDVGAGAGMPGIPLKILFPKVRVVLLESITKKTRFLHHIVDCLKLSSVEVLTGRAEELAHQENYREKLDLVVSRAVGKLPTLAELTLPFCRVGGLFVAPRKGKLRKK